MTILYIILIIIAIPLIVALLIKKEYRVVRNVIINKPLSEVFNYMKFLKNQDHYSKWAMVDSNMKKSFSGTDGEVGFISAWESDNKKLGVGEQEIKKIVENERLDFELRFFKPFKATHVAFIETKKVDENQTHVSWGFDGNMKYPMNLMLLFMNFDKMLGDDLATGLSRLKLILEKNQPKYSEVLASKNVDTNQN